MPPHVGGIPANPFRRTSFLVSLSLLGSSLLVPRRGGLGRCEWVGVDQDSAIIVTYFLPCLCAMRRAKFPLRSMSRISVRSFVGRPAYESVSAASWKPVSAVPGEEGRGKFYKHITTFAMLFGSGQFSGIKQRYNILAIGQRN